MPSKNRAADGKTKLSFADERCRVIARCEACGISYSNRPETGSTGNHLIKITAEMPELVKFDA